MQYRQGFNQGHKRLRRGGGGGVSDGWDKCLEIRNRNYFKLPFSPVNTKHCDSVRE